MDYINFAAFERIKASGNLPSPKGVALAIMRLTQEEDASTAELAHIVKSDPAFVGRVIKAANSVSANPGRPIVAVQDALVVLGMPTVRNLALGFSLLSQHRRGACRAFDYESFWSGSLACAIALQALTLHTRAAQAEETFSVGLLARVGELALATLFHEEYDRILRAVGAGDFDKLLRAEREQFALNHRELTAAMLSDWGLPRSYCDAVFHHEEPGGVVFFLDQGRESTHIKSITLSRAIAAACVAGETGGASRRPRVLELGQRLAMSDEQLQPLCDGVASEWREWAAVLNLAARPVPPFEEGVKNVDVKHRHTPAAATGAAQEPGNTLRALVIVSDAGARADLKASVEAQGYHVFEAGNGQEGLSAALECQPHVVVADSSLAEMDGLALTRALREARVGRAIYILLLNESGTDAALVAALDVGADECMAKPPDPRLLAARLRTGRRIGRLREEIEREHEEARRFAAELSVANRRLQEAALTDALTGFPNRSYALERLRQEWAGIERHKRPLACIVIDLDQLQQVNDTYGQVAGDACIKQAATSIRAVLRAQDVVCRIGGDEFLVICPDTDLPSAIACAERVRGTIEATPVKIGLLKIGSTVSIGVAVRETAMSDAEALIRRADQGVYMAKQRGRNRAASPQVVTH